MESLSNIYNTKEYKSSRIAYAMQCTFEYFVMLLVADAFLANLLSNMGISDALTGGNVNKCAVEIYPKF